MKSLAGFISLDHARPSAEAGDGDAQEPTHRVTVGGRISGEK